MVKKHRCSLHKSFIVTSRLHIDDFVAYALRSGYSIMIMNTDPYNYLLELMKFGASNTPSDDFKLLFIDHFNTFLDVKESLQFDSSKQTQPQLV